MDPARTASPALPVVADANRPTHPSTVARWATRGVPGPDGSWIRLEAIRVHGRLMTSRPALVRFIAVLQVPVPPPRSPDGRRIPIGGPGVVTVWHLTAKRPRPTADRRGAADGDPPHRNRPCRRSGGGELWLPTVRPEELKPLALTPMKHVSGSVASGAKGGPDADGTPGPTGESAGGMAPASGCAGAGVGPRAPVRHPRAAGRPFGRTADLRHPDGGVGRSVLRGARPRPVSGRADSRRGAASGRPRQGPARTRS